MTTTLAGRRLTIADLKPRAAPAVEPTPQAKLVESTEPVSSTPAIESRPTPTEPTPSWDRIDEIAYRLVHQRLRDQKRLIEALQN
jgi:hypothetical protein